MLNVQVVNKSFNDLPEYSTIGSAGMDVRASVTNELGYIALYPNETKLIPTGLFFAVPEGYEMQIRPRSGLALKNEITVLNTPGTLDSDYRGELGIILHNFGKSTFFIKNGDRIAQIVFNKYESAVLSSVVQLDETERGTDGFGSSGVK
jgi:dUTP pyrophosphatase